VTQSASLLVILLDQITSQPR